MMYEFEPRTMAGLDGLEALFGLGLPCCTPSQTPAMGVPAMAVEATGCDPSCQTSETITFAGGSGSGSGGGGGGGGYSPCPPGLVDPTLVSLFGGPCTLAADGTFYYGGIPAGSIPPSAVPHGSAPPQQPTTSIWPVVLVAGLFLLLVKK